MYNYIYNYTNIHIPPLLIIRNDDLYCFISWLWHVRVESQWFQYPSAKCNRQGPHPFFMGVGKMDVPHSWQV